MAYHARSAQLLSQAATVLGYAEEAQEYSQLAESIRCSFAAVYVNQNGRIRSVRRGCTQYAWAPRQRWEQWDALLPDGSIHPRSMTSFNHYAYGAVANWMHRTIGDLETASSAYRTVRISPRPGGGLTESALRFDRPYGPIAVDWEVTPEFGMRLRPDIPFDTTANVYLPDGVTHCVTHGMCEFHSGVAIEAEDQIRVAVGPKLGSGES